MDQRHINEQTNNEKILNQTEKVWGRSGIVGRARIARRAASIITYCQLQPGQRVLEIGCGTGTLTVRLVETGASVVSLDVFDQFLEQARRRCSAAPNVSFVRGDAETLADFPDASFNAVCGISILHHLNLTAALESVYRVLKPGGTVAFSEPNMLNPQIALQKNIPWLKDRAGDSPDETAFFRWRLRRDFIKHRFKAVVVEPFDFLHPRLPDAIFSSTSKLLLNVEKIPLVREIAGSLLIHAKK